MKRALATAAVVLLGCPLGSAAQDQPLVAGRDVQTPKKIYAPQPVYPLMARSAGLQGLILLEITLDAEGRPTDIKVLRGIPLLDRAAIEAVKTWRYEPTLDDGVLRRIVLLEALDFFLSDADMVQAYSDMATSRRQPAAFRVLAISRLLELPAKGQKAVAKTLQKLLEDPDQSVAKAADAALAKLPTQAR